MSLKGLNTFDQHAHSNSQKTMQDLAHAIEILGLEMLKKIVGMAMMKHGLEFVSKAEKMLFF